MTSISNINKRDVVLFVTHRLNDSVIGSFIELGKELPNDSYDVVLLYQKEDDVTIEIAGNILLFICNNQDIKELGYKQIDKRLLPGSTNYPLLYFFKCHPYYETYWFIEYDVHFTGNWPILLNNCREELGNYDFLSCHIERYCKCNSTWPWWFYKNSIKIPFVKYIKGFNPICRYSNRALACLDNYLKQGFSAHSEVMITTCLYHHGMKIGDIGGQGEFVPKGWENRYYLAGEGVNNGTMRYRPVYTREEIEKTGLKNKLFHPLKE